MFGFSRRKKKKTQETTATTDTLPPLKDTPKDFEPPKIVSKTNEDEVPSSLDLLEPTQERDLVEKEPTELSASPQKTDKTSWFSRVKSGLSKTRSSFSKGVANLFLGRKTLDADTLEELETLLLTADIGIEATQRIITDLTDRISRKEINDSNALIRALQETLQQILMPVEQPLEINHSPLPFVVLVVGVNGAGKTTTIGKMANFYQNQGKSVMLAAGDTFRAAAVEQLQVWGERNNIPVIAQHTGADSASVIFDAVQSAAARNIDIIIADTAGRLHNKENLMGELEKIQRVLKKLDPNAPHETLLVLDAGTGQNAISQLNAFNQCLPLSGLVLTKLDGTAKGGIIFALAQKFSIPIRFIGVGEKMSDLNTFEAKLFVDALLTGADTELRADKE